MDGFLFGQRYEKKIFKKVFLWGFIMYSIISQAQQKGHHLVIKNSDTLYKVISAGALVGKLYSKVLLDSGKLIMPYNVKCKVKSFAMSIHYKYKCDCDTAFMPKPMVSKSGKLTKKMKRILQNPWIMKCVETEIAIYDITCRNEQGTIKAGVNITFTIK